MGTAINLDEIKRFEVTEVYSHPDAKVDIVFVHGLNGDPRRTWTGKETGTFWPTQLLPASLKSAQARILVYGYNADVYTFGKDKSASTDLIHHHAQTFIANLALERKSEEVEDHPIIFVAHSLGGILVKRALELSNDLTSKNADDNRSIFVSTYGIIFLGTPHNGADPAKWGLILSGMVSALVPKKIMHSESQLVKTLQSNNETLQNINLHFLDIYQKFKICMVHEAAPTDLKGGKAFVVDKDSAAPMLPDVLYFGIEATHSGMCKFESKNSPGYMNVSTTLKSWVQEAGPIIQARWENERRQRWQSRQAQAAELLGAFPAVTPQTSTKANTPGTLQHSTSSQQTYRQPGLVEAAPSQQDYGRPWRSEAAPSQQQFVPYEVEEVEDEPEVPRHPSNSMNNSTIMVKSTANIEPQDSQTEDSQFFIKPSGFRPNSLFEGRQTELAELHKMLFDKKRREEGTSAVLIQSMPGGGKSHLAREYVYRHKSDYPGGIFWLRAKSITELAAGYWDIARKAVLTNLSDHAEALSPIEKDSEQYIRVVRKWLNSRRGWLMVLDGIHFNETTELRKFIPDSVDTGLIYTSTEKSVSGNYLFMNPQVIKLPLLSAREAQRLLLLELDRKEPFSQEDLKNSMQLVQAMEFLPVVIHAVAQRLKSTEEPLSRFARNYASEPRLRGLGTYKDVVRQLNVLGASETLNLIYILCFFSQHIPVEMISLGLHALDSPYHVPVKASEPISGRSLNNTFKMLNMFALIERNEQETVQSSQSSGSSRNMLADNVDVIRLHSVVQGFFIDTLFAAGSLPLWLDHAVRLFCCSYDRAHDRITRKPNAGLVEDYRLYEIHGNRMREHLVKHLSPKHIKEDNRLILEEAQKTLDLRLEAIKAEIERRTPESSHVIAVGRPDVFQTSIFDRSSSSSDAGPETPGTIDRNLSQVSTWGLEPDQGQYESPVMINQDAVAFNRQQLEEIYRKNFPLPLPEDAGYDSDRESATGTAMQESHSQQTVRQPDDATAGSGNWEVVNYRRTKPRPLTSPQHRSIRHMERQRYSDSAGAYRAVTTADPRLSRETALGSFGASLQGTSTTRDVSRGRNPLSGVSGAEVSLAHISKNSPPPARGGGKIQDKRSSSQRGSERPRMISGLSSYAAAVAGSTKDTILSWTGIDSSSNSRPSTADASAANAPHSSASTTPVERPSSSAVESLQKFGTDINASPKPSPRLTHATITPSLMPIPPYPTSPLKSPVSGRPGTYPFPEQQHQRSRSLTQGQGSNPYPSNIYPRMEGPPPFESLTNSSTGTAGRSIPAPIPLPHPRLDSHHASESHSPPGLSLSFPDIRTHHCATSPRDTNVPYIPGHPEFSTLSSSSFINTKASGYSSQPMSRDPSGQSNQSNQGQGQNQPPQQGGRRRPSFAETEPPPQLPTFSPKIPPTSYQVYERLRALEEDKKRGGDARLTREEWESVMREVGGGILGTGGEVGVGVAGAKKSPRLEYARAALIEKLEDWNSPSSAAASPSLRAVDENRPVQREPRRSFNPTAPSFTPSYTFSPSSTTPPPTQFSTYPHSPFPVPPVPPNSTFSSTGHSPIPPYLFNTTTPPHSQPQPQLHAPRTTTTTPPATATTTPQVAGSGNGGEEMQKTSSGSGGVKVGKQLIEFGDFPDKIDVDVVRERAWRRLLEKEREDRERREREQAERTRVAGILAAGGKVFEGDELGIYLDD